MIFRVIGVSGESAEFLFLTLLTSGDIYFSQRKIQYIEWFSRVGSVIPISNADISGTRDLANFRQLRDTGHEFYILSDGNQDMLDKLAANTGFDKYLYDIVSVEDVEVFKPYPESLRKHRELH